MEKIRLGYHTVSDDCVTSCTLDAIEAIRSITETMNDNPDVDHMWIRNEANEVVWEWRQQEQS